MATQETQRPAEAANWPLPFLTLGSPQGSGSTQLPPTVMTLTVNQDPTLKANWAFTSQKLIRGGGKEQTAVIAKVLFSGPAPEVNQEYGIHRKDSTFKWKTVYGTYGISVAMQNQEK